MTHLNKFNEAKSSLTIYDKIHKFFPWFNMDLLIFDDNKINSDTSACVGISIADYQDGIASHQYLGYKNLTPKNIGRAENILKEIQEYSDVIILDKNVNVKNVSSALKSLFKNLLPIELEEMWGYTGDEDDGFYSIEMNNSTIGLACKNKILYFKSIDHYTNNSTDDIDNIEDSLTSLSDDGLLKITRKEKRVKGNKHGIFFAIELKFNLFDLSHNNTIEFYSKISYLNKMGYGSIISELICPSLEEYNSKNKESYLEIFIYKK